MNNQIEFNQTVLIRNSRKSSLPIDKQFLERWSPRAYDESVMPHRDLMTVFEAARWAPSAYNVQPWRFLYALREDRYWSQYLSLLDPFNSDWAKRSGALVFLISDTLTSREPPKPFPSHSFDAGSAWTQLALQAQKLGYQAHAMGGILHSEIHEQLNIPKRYKIEIGIAIGRPAEPKILAPNLLKRERPSTRRPLAEIVCSGTFSLTASSELES